MIDATRTRKEVSRHRREVQRSFLVPDEPDDPEREAPVAPAPPSRVAGPPPCRMALARWPDEWRERWGRRANQLEDAGLPWHEAEAQAFVEVWNERRALGQTDHEPGSATGEAVEPERN